MSPKFATDPRVHADPHTSTMEHTTSPVLSASPVITPPKSGSRGLLTDLVGWPSYSYKRSQAPSGENGGVHPSGSLTRAGPTPGAHQKPSHLPTPQSPGDMTSYLLTRTPTSSQNTLQPDPESDVLPTEFGSSVSSSSPAPHRPHSIPTPDSSPLVARSRGPHLLSQPGRTSSHDESNMDGSPSRASTPPRTPSRQVSTRPVTPTAQSRPITPSQWRSTERSPRSSRCDNPTSSPLQRIKDEPGTDVAPLIEYSPATNEATELRPPDYFKRIARLASGNDEATHASESGAKDALLWSSANLGIIDSPTKGKRIALFQETSDESFEESLMAGGYASYRSDRPSLKVDGDAEAPNPFGEATAEELGSGMLTEAEKRKKARLAAFFHRRPLSAPLLPVEMEGCGRVLVKADPSEPQTPPKPTPKGKRSRRRKKVSDTRPVVDRAAVLEAHTVDGPNWPDTEFPWRSRLMTADGLSSTEREERLRYITSFLERESDEEDEGHSSSSSSDEPSRSARSGGDRLLLLRKDRQHGSTGSVIPCDPADARVALLSKKSIRAVQLRLLRRNTDRSAQSDDGEVLCICRGRDDGRALVQCDACRTWYHLECIGIQSTSELGREEDPWFCGNCVAANRLPPVDVLMSEPTLVPTDSGEQDVGYDPPFLNAGLHPSPATPSWTRPVRPPTTPPRRLHAPQIAWDEAPSSSSRGDPRTPPFGTASGFGDTARVYGTTPGRLLEPSLSTSDAFDPTSTPSRGIMFGLPFATPKDGRWRGGHELFHTPRRGEDGTASVRYHGRVGETPEGPSGMIRAATNNVTPVERTLKRIQGMESPLGTKRSRPPSACPHERV